jgi:hypothetical protein
MDESVMHWPPYNAAVATTAACGAEYHRSCFRYSPDNVTCTKCRATEVFVHFEVLVHVVYNGSAIDAYLAEEAKYLGVYETR